MFKNFGDFCQFWFKGQTFCAGFLKVINSKYCSDYMKMLTPRNKLKERQSDKKSKQIFFLILKDLKMLTI